MESVLEQLQQEPALAWKLVVNVLGAEETSAEAMHARQAVWESPLVRQLVATCNRHQGV